MINKIEKKPKILVFKTFREKKVFMVIYLVSQNLKRI